MLAPLLTIEIDLLNRLAQRLERLLLRLCREDDLGRNEDIASRSVRLLAPCSDCVADFLLVFVVLCAVCEGISVMWQ